MKNRMLRMMALVLALMTMFAMTATASAAAAAPAAPAFKDVKGLVVADAVGIKVTWNKVSGAKGYQYRYCLFASDSTTEKDFTAKNTTKTAAKLYFQDCGNIEFQVRAYKLSKGKKVYGEWQRFRLTQQEVDNLVAARVKEIEAKLATKVTKVARAKEKDALALKYTWKKVSGADGYEYRYDLFWASSATESDFTVKKTSKTAAKIGFQAFDDITFQVRAYKQVGSGRIYGDWAEYKLTKAQATKLLK